MYSGKRFAFSPLVYRARCQLASLDCQCGQRSQKKFRWQKYSKYFNFSFIYGTCIYCKTRKMRFNHLLPYKNLSVQRIQFLMNPFFCNINTIFMYRSFGQHRTFNKKSGCQSVTPVTVDKSSEQIDILKERNTGYTNRPGKDVYSCRAEYLCPAAPEQNHSSSEPKANCGTTGGKSISLHEKNPEILSKPVENCLVYYVSKFYFLAHLS